MMAFQAHPGGMQQHPGAPPGHPMAPGMAHNPSQPGATQAGIPHNMMGHMGVSGPGPQMNAAALMGGGMPPGAGHPGPHGMPHLNPAQAQLYQQQQMSAGIYAHNPALQQLQQQQRLAELQLQQRQRAAMIQQAGQYNNLGQVPIGIPLGQMNQMNPAHIAAMRRMPVPLPAHLQQTQLAQHQQAQSMNHVNMAQQIALQQQHQQQLNQMQNNPNHGQMNPQAIISQQAQMAAMQQQAQQAQQQAAQQVQQQAAQQQAAQQGQQQPQQPQQQQPQQQQPPQQPGQPQRQATPSQAGPNGQAPTPAPTQGPTPQPNPQQQPHAPPQTPQTTQGQPIQQVQLVAQAQHAAQAQVQAQAAQAQAVQAQAQAVHNQQQAAGLAMMQQQQQQQQKRNGMELKGQCLLKLMQFSEHLSGFPGPKGSDDLSYWEDFVKMFFSQKGVFKHTLLERTAEGPVEKPYEIQYPALPRYFHSHFDSGVKTMQLIMAKGTTDRALPNDCHFIENTKASLIYRFDQNCHVVADGILRASFDSEQKFELFEFITTDFEEFVPRSMVIQAARPAHNWVKEWHALNSPDNKQSPEMNKKNKTKQLKTPAGPPPDLELPDSYVSPGRAVPGHVYQFLEMSEIMGQMTPLFDFFHAHPGIAPYAAMEQYVSRINSGAHQGMNGQPMPQGGPRTPSFGQFPMGASPAMANIGLPGSPHVVNSPAPGQLAAPVMQHQMSQPGTSSSGPSANTSPAQGNKRRRSTVKEEDTPQSAPTPGAMGTPQMNGVGIPGKGKQPPTPRMQKRMKGNPA
ncbi:hypothetical protein QC761_305240 [Podospora bellae-mahoneyi]|uniref:LIM-domain binding protein-domain-containing protein n=1 Tax=Podospora bellae-mahoneyi TaxID=2093777 RepID=A0ABR0FM05_9PEZI|nr:hypothetical protein QC761_305240 [Podospora bellae-mahoneyi]